MAAVPDTPSTPDNPFEAPGGLEHLGNDCFEAKRHHLAVAWLIGLAVLQVLSLSLCGILLFLFLVSRLRVYRKGARVGSCIICSLLVVAGLAVTVMQWRDGGPMALHVWWFSTVLSREWALVVHLALALVWLPPVLLLFGTSMRDHYTLMRRDGPRPRHRFKRFPRPAAAQAQEADAAPRPSAGDAQGPIAGA